MGEPTFQKATSHRSRRGCRGIAAVAAVALVFSVAGCGSDSDDAESDETTTTTTEAVAAEPTVAAATLTDEAIEGLSEEIPAGLVEVTVTDDTTDGGAGGDLSIMKVAEGTTEEDFVAGLLPVFEGGPIPEFIENSSGVIDEGTIVLEEGSYIAWIDRASALDRESTADDIITTPVTVGPGETDAALPEADGTITATDYAFDVDVPAGEATINFANDSTEQFHHVILVDFGTNDPALIEENLGAILESEDGSVPEGVDGEQIDFEAGGSSVFGPGSSGSFSAELTEGNTYAALCFISDVAGGAPHSIQHDMSEVFTA